MVSRSWVLRVGRARVLVLTRASCQGLIGPGFGFRERPVTGATHTFPAGTCSQGSREVTVTALFPPWLSPLDLQLDWVEKRDEGMTCLFLNGGGKRHSELLTYQLKAVQTE